MDSLKHAQESAQLSRGKREPEALVQHGGRETRKTVPTREPPMAQLRTAQAMGTLAGSTARISAVGASNTGFTSTNQRSPGNGRRWMSRGLQLLCPWKHA